MNNPFRPSAGATPPEIIGRVGLLDEFAYGLRLGSGAPGLLTIFTGETLLRLLDKNQTGLAITVDEIHAADRSEIAQLAANVQHFIQDGLPIGLVFAGLPAAVSDLLNEGVATFLRRS